MPDLGNDVMSGLFQGTVEATEEAIYNSLFKATTERANGIWKRLLAEALPPALDPEIAQALDAFVTRRKREIAVG